MELKSNDLNINNVGLYVITFNSPNQVKTLIKSMNQYDKDFVEKPQWILLDNSTDLETTPEYKKLCEEHDIIHVKKDNLGICGGRQWIAEDAEKRGYDYYFFFEDDMFFYPKKGEVGKNGFNRFVDGLYRKSLQISKKNDFDLAFSLLISGIESISQVAIPKMCVFKISTFNQIHDCF